MNIVYELAEMTMAICARVGFEKPGAGAERRVLRSSALDLGPWHFLISVVWCYSGPADRVPRTSVDGALLRPQHPVLVGLIFRRLIAFYSAF